VVFPVVADMHSESEPVMKKPTDWKGWWDSKMHLLYARRAARAFGADFFADLGDIGMDRWNKGGLPDWESHMKPRMELQYQLYSGCRIPVLFAVGNHDLGHPKFQISKQQWGECFNLRQKRERLGATQLGADGTWGYLDIPAKRTRAILLNTTDTGAMKEGVSAEQTEWLAGALDSTPAGWRVVALSHISLHETLGDWHNGAGKRHRRTDGFVRVRTLFERFAASRGTPVFSVAGHSHLDAEISENGVSYVVTQSYGTTPWQKIDPLTRYSLLNRNATLLVDMFALKPSTGEMRVFRIGHGGESADRVLPRDANLGARCAAFCGSEARLVVPGVSRTVRFRVSEGEAAQRDMTAETRDGIRFVWIDNKGGEITKAQFDFFAAESAGPAPVALILSVPLYMAGLSVEEAPCAHPDWKMPPGHPEIATRTGWLGGGHSNTTLHFRWNVVNAPRLAGVFCVYGRSAFSAVERGAVECSAPAGTTLDVAVNA